MEENIVKKDDVKKVVTPVSFGEINKAEIRKERDLNIFVDIPQEIIIELGKSKMSLRDVLELDEGSVIELNKQAGESIDIYVEDELIAKGEVVVIEDRFGVRITEIVKLTHLEKRVL